MVSDPLERAELISDIFTVALAVTVSVPPESDQPEPELASEEIVNV
jgi:hypothetical protein